MTRKQRTLVAQLCPVCGGENETVEASTPSGDGYVVQCVGRNCGLMGPMRVTPSLALEAWNRLRCVSADAKADPARMEDG